MNAGKQTRLSSRKSFFLKTVFQLTVLLLAAAPFAASQAGALASATRAAATSHKLTGVSCPSATDCWAVGDRDAASGARLNQVLHWTGKKWFSVAVPSQGGTKAGESELKAVRCLSASDCWAVGDSESAGQNSPELNQVLHWNGKAWRLVTVPDPAALLTQVAGQASAPFLFNRLSDIACRSPRNCWAVGDFGVSPSGGGPAIELTEVLRWNGTKWSVVFTPNPAGTAGGDENSLSSVRCPSPSVCWAVGVSSQVTDRVIVSRNVVLHLSGGKWAAVSVPDPAGTASEDFNQLTSLACTSAANCTAVGGYGTFSVTSLNQVLRWNGKKWGQVAAPNPDGTGTDKENFLQGISCDRPTDCWAVGSLSGLHEPALNEALHWNGTAWTHVSTPQPGGRSAGAFSALQAVSCASSASCFAVGSAAPNGQGIVNQILRWTGRKWVVD
jgi:hypothetical protein